MSDISSLLERADRAASRVPLPEGGVERILTRRSRKLRHQRITAGVAGIAVFVAVLWFVRDVASLNRPEETVVPGGLTVARPYQYDPTADYVGLPPDGAEPSDPETSELVVEAQVLHVGWVYVFEDGRVISSFAGPMGSLMKPPGITEQRLTPQGVELVRSGVLQASDFVCFEGLPYPSLPHGCNGPIHEIPASAWEDSGLQPYVPYRYAICGSGPRESELVPSLRELPMAAQDLLRGKEAVFDVAWTQQGAECFDVSTDEARALDEILADAGFQVGTDGGYERWSDEFGPDGIEPWVSFEPILPHGTFGSMGGG